MDQKRLPLFIALSVAILLMFQFLSPPAPRRAAPSGPRASVAAGVQAPSPSAPHLADEPKTVSIDPAKIPRVKIQGPRVTGSISLLGARLDDLSLRDYHETIAKTSPLVRVLTPVSDAQPTYVQFGWSSTDGVKLPDSDTIWTSSGGDASPGHPVILSWNNGAGLDFHITLTVDENYLFTAQQSVRNAGSAAVQVWPWQRVRRDYLPAAGGYNVFEGVLGVAEDRIHRQHYGEIKSEADKHNGVAYQGPVTGGWAGFTDKYWLTALVPPDGVTMTNQWRHWSDAGTDRFEVNYLSADPLKIAPGEEASQISHVFAGAKEVHRLAAYESDGHIRLLSYAVDWGWLYFLAKPMFYAIDFIYGRVGNFGVAILIFTLCVKALFYPIASRSFRSMGKMRLLGPKITEVRERYKDDPQKLQSEMMAVYKAENVSPVSGCAPMLLQIPVFISLYTVISIAIEMRHAPFFGWIQDLSVIDPTNIFNLFGLVPFDPTSISPFLHLGIWPLIMGGTMYLQQKLNPPAPDPAQQKMMQYMPLIFMFTMGRSPAGLVIYWSWNNALSMAQQWYIQRQSTLEPKARVART